MASKRLLIQKTDRLLADLLGLVDAYFEPWRKPYGGNNAFAAVHEGQARYRKGGLPWPQKRTTAAARKGAERARQLLVENGYAETFSGRIALTPLGHAKARHVVGLPTVSEAGDMLNRLVYLTPIVPRDDVAAGWVREHEWFDRPHPKDGRVNGPNGFSADIEEILSLLVAGNVESLTDARGIISYRVLVDCVHEDDVTAGVLCDEVQPSNEASRIYSDRLAEVWHSLRTAKPLDPSCIWIPLTCSPNRFAAPDDWRPGDFRPENYAEATP